MKIALVTKAQMLNSKVRCELINHLKDSGEFEFVELSALKKGDFVDKILVFGGDGTVLEAVRYGLNAPIVGVNLGKLGFLTQFESDVTIDELKCALKDNSVNCKMLLSVQAQDNAYLALNEAVLKSETSRPLYIDVYVDKKFVDCYHGDGVIVSTPTGSTAYSLSAGGPVVTPDVEALVINPICAHSLHSRPIVVSSNSSIELVLKGDLSANLCIDGENVKVLGENGRVCISKSEQVATFTQVNDGNFYKKLLEKMNVWGVTTSHKG